MTETYFARIIDVLPSRVMLSIPSDPGEDPIIKTLDSTAMQGVIDLRPGNVMKITIETTPGKVVMEYAPANKSDYRE